MVTATSAVNWNPMQKYRTKLLLILSFTIISCVSENSNDSALIALDSPVSDRQIMTSHDVELKALILVNDETQQIFNFTSSDFSLPVNVNGVRRDEQNEISIKWFEILHGHTVEISEQSQNFVADGNTTIDVAHNYTQFDYDDDGMSNLAELSNGTCVWSATENCVNQGQTDIPTDNALLNGDFSDENSYWFSELTKVAEGSGEYCVYSPATTEDWVARIDYLVLPIFIDSNSSYNIAFDVRAQIDSEVFVHMVAESRPNEYTGLIEQLPVSVSTTYDRKSVRYESKEEAYSEVSISFIFRNSTDNTYCFDNIKLIKEATQ